MSPSGRVTARIARRFITSDTHIGHRLMSGLRGYGKSLLPGERLTALNESQVTRAGQLVRDFDIARHDAYVIDTWNSRVRPDDVVFHAGDVFLGPHSNIEKIALLNGKKHLITGNHDEIFAGHRQSWRNYREWAGYFESINAFLRINVDDIKCLISHFPYAGYSEGAPSDRIEGRYEEYRLPDEGHMLLHGHTHAGEPFTYRDPGKLVPNMIHIGWDTWNGPIEIDTVVKATIAELRKKVCAGE